MPGFMGLRGLEVKSPLDMQKERRKNEGDTRQFTHDLERRSREKVQEILSEQENDMAGHSGDMRPIPSGECDKISGRGITDIMSGRVAVLSFDDTLLTVQGIFASVRFRHLPIVDDSGNIIGIISDRDLLRMVSPFYGTVNEQTRDIEIMNRKVGMVMTRNPTCVDVNVTILDAVRLMNAKNISCLPILEVGTRRLLGIVTWKDVVRVFCPRGFSASDSNRLKTGVHINPESRESARLRAKASESARLRAVGTGADRQHTKPSASSSDTDRISINPERHDINPKLPDTGRPTIPSSRGTRIGKNDGAPPPPPAPKSQKDDLWG